MRVIVTIGGGVAEVAYRPDAVEVVLVDFDDLRENANTDRRIRALGFLGERITSLSGRGRVEDSELDEITHLVQRIEGAPA